MGALEKVSNPTFADYSQRFRRCRRRASFLTAPSANRMICCTLGSCALRERDDRAVDRTITPKNMIIFRAQTNASPKASARSMISTRKRVAENQFQP